MPPRVLFSPDGQRPANFPVNEAEHSEVVKLVVGTLPGSDDIKTASAATLETVQDWLNLSTLGTDFPHLTHLHLWRLHGMKRLSGLPPGLKCLDVRYALDLEAVEEVPSEVGTLDLGHNPKLRQLQASSLPKLSELFLDGCENFRPGALENLIETISVSGAPLVEANFSHCPAFTTAEDLPKTLTKLVLAGCPRLETLDDLAEFSSLRHLNLQHCLKLSRIGSLPDPVQFLVVFGSTALVEFAGQSVGAVDRGESEGENVAPLFLTRQKFGETTKWMVHAKLLLLGDGRVGKTTLAKRLQWNDLSLAEKVVRPDLNPAQKPPFTHKVQFWNWKTELRIPHQTPGTASEALLREDETKIDGHVRIWDFGGQDIYHQTHRAFASEGNIHLILWRGEQPPIDDSKPIAITDEEWEAWNRQRPLDYWIDYLKNLRDDAKPMPQWRLVCTKCPGSDPRPSLANRVEETSLAHSLHDLYYIDSLNETDPGQLPALTQWIREACGSEAVKNGLKQPEFFVIVADLVDSLLQSGDPKNRMMPWSDWKVRVAEAYDTFHTVSNPPALTDGDILQVTEYLHRTNHLFRIGKGEDLAVLINQEWATSLIYRMLQPNHASESLFAKIREHRGIFSQIELEEDPVWRTVSSAFERERLLHYMIDCRLVAKIANGEGNRGRGTDLYLATNRWLLPAYDEVREQCESIYRELASLPFEATAFTFESQVVSEFDFRRLLTLLAQKFGLTGAYFREGLIAWERDTRPDWYVSLQWISEKRDGYLGRLDLVLRASDAQILAELKGRVLQTMDEAGSPFPKSAIPLPERSVSSADFGHARFVGMRPDDYDLGLSSSGGNKDNADAIVQALLNAGFEVNHYRREECRLDDKAGVLAFIHSLSQHPCLVLYLSESYLATKPENWYCLYEMADAVVQLGTGKILANGSRAKRSPEKTIVLFERSDSCKTSKLYESIESALKFARDFFIDEYTKLDPDSRTRFSHYLDLHNHFSAALEPQNITAFKEHKIDPDQPLPIEELRADNGAALIKRLDGVTTRRRIVPIPPVP